MTVIQLKEHKHLLNSIFGLQVCISAKALKHKKKDNQENIIAFCHFIQCHL